MSNGRRLRGTIPTIFRYLALACLSIGFLGSVITDGSPLSGDTLFSALFIVGIGSAVVSIYLGILLHEPVSDDQ